MDINDSTRYFQALAFAAQKHCAQQRKDKSPYILHPIRVSMLLATKGLDVRYQIVALFHDLLEDTDATDDELKKFCNDEMLTGLTI